MSSTYCMVDFIYALSSIDDHIVVVGGQFTIQLL